MYGKKLIRKIGSLVVIATLIASAFVILPNGNGVANGNSVHDVGISTDYEGAVNGIKITRDGTDVVGANDSLVIGEIYKIRYKLINNGDFNESVNVKVMVGNVTIANHNYSLDAGESDTYADGWDTTGLTPGNYTINVSVSIDNDSNLSNNIAQRTVMLEEYPVSIDLLYPTAGDIIGGIIPIKWNASSTKGKLTVKIEYKNETGEWKTIADNLDNNDVYYWDATGLEKGKNYTVRITATDEEGNNKSAESGFFTITQLDASIKTAYYNDIKNIHVNNTAGIVTLYRSNGTVYEAQNGSTGDVIFFNVNFDIVGIWKIEDTVRGIFYIRVLPIKLNVSVSPESADFVKTGTASYVTLEGYVKDDDGNPMKNITVEIWTPAMTAGEGAPLKTVLTNESGYYKLENIRIALYGAGKYNITARDGPFANPNAFGYTIFTVNSVEANVSLKNNTAVGGFDIGEIIFEVADSSGNDILYHNYNISVYKDGKLYAWINNTGTSNTTKMNFSINGKTLTLSSNMWETGDYIIKVKADVVGSSTWEYTGSQDFSISPAPPVNLKLLSSKTINVSDPAHNVKIIIVQIFGENMTTYGDEEHGFNDENITKRLTVEGDVLYTPPKEAYEYHGNGIWWIKVFPAHGNGKIYVNVKWPNKGTDNVTITVDEGGYVSVTPTEVIVDTPATVEAEVKDKTQQIPFYNANVTIVYEEGLYGKGDTIVSSQHANTEGKYVFTNFTSTIAGVNIIVIASFDYNGTKYAYALIESRAAHDLSVDLAPSKALAGERTEFTVNITRDNKSYEDESGFYFYILNESQLTKLHNGEIKIDDLTPVSDANIEKKGKGNYTIKYTNTTSGTYYLYVISKNEKHDIPAGSEPSFEITKASVSASPMMLVKNVDKNMTVTFTVTWNGKPLNGTLCIHNITTLTTYDKDTDLEVKNGEVNITGIDAIATGNITFEFKPKGTGNQFAPAAGMLKVVTPDISVIEPATGIAYLGVENLIVIKVTHPVTGNGCEGLDVRVEMPDGSVIDVGKTGNDGKLMFGVIPLETGKIYLDVEGERAKNVEINVVIGLRINAPNKIEKGKEMTIVVTTKGGNPVEGAIVKADGSQIGETDANGIVKYKPENSGTITITAEKEGYHKASISVEVTKPPKEQPGFELIGFAIALLAAILIARRKRK